MEGAFQLLVFATVMLMGSYGAGSIPLFMSMSKEKLQLVSVLGAGLLLGTALAVIIPEGMQTLVAAYTQPRPAAPAEAATKDAADDQHGRQHELDGIDKTIGASLVLGFLFMLLLDQLASSRCRRRAGGDAEAASGPGRAAALSWTTTLGLVVHAAADGIALGAAATTKQVDVEVIVFLAIMLHKAPAAFGLVTFLLHEGLDAGRARKHLLTFSLAAPLLAVVTFFSLNASGTQMDTFHATGVAMLFSAGTFLYVATVHVLPEVTGGGGSGGHSHGPSADGKHGFSKCELLLIVVGTLFPMILTLGHHH